MKQSLVLVVIGTTVGALGGNGESDDPCVYFRRDFIRSNHYGGRHSRHLYRDGACRLSSRAPPTLILRHHC